ncbi:cache domain-containing sensor histidine kinase [Anaeromassilibacillus sp. 1001302B_160321_C8]|uniref:cache domain-containing sensor histidine kinase n=1 Tax=Anaeromassilibacillus sp. 1001302B_160321_C8 TaxID=2787132 RepID=UPI001FACADD2|nr:sensor histidine kinase [Anaeromassilibacillus sp. 1001302B_160321_C8]
MNVSLRTRMLLSNIVVALIPFLMFSIVSGSIFLDHAQKTAEEHSVQLIHQVSNSMDVYVETIEKMVNYIQLELQDTPFFTMETEGASGWESETDYIRSVLENVANSHREVAGIFIATKEDLYVSTGMSRISRDPFQNERWYREASENPEEIQLISVVTGRNIVTNRSYSIDDVFSLAKAVQDPETGEVLGVILLDIRHDIIQSSINGVTIGEKGFVFVMDQEDNIVYTPVNGIVYRVNPKWVKAMEPMSVQIQGGSYQIRSELSPYTGWRTVGVFSMDEVMSSVNTIVYILFTCVIISLVLVVIVSFKFSRTLTNPIFKLKRLMKQAESGDLTVRFNFQHNDEIGELGQSFNHMIARIDQLIQMVYVEQENKRTAEMKSLQEQIKPHFLYNTLDTISWMARDYDAEDIVRLVDALTNMFRIGLSHGKDIITVKEEITHVSNYLYIQKIRYKDKLNYVIHVDESLYAIEVPKLILQPLVENAIYHGVKAKRGGTITITGVPEGENLVFTVQDNGAGMPQEKVEELNRRMSERSVLDEKKSFGLFYIRERIQLCYGTGYGVHVESALGEGTRVTITLPLYQKPKKFDEE